MSATQNILVCPKCKSTLMQKYNSLYCESCGLVGVMEGKILDLLGNKGYYWGEVRSGYLEEIIKNAQKMGWRLTLKEVISRYPKLSDCLLANIRVDWLFHCLNFFNVDSCLDLGSGWGNLTFALANFFKEVYSLEAVKNKLIFQSIRQQQEKIPNIKFIRADWLDLPFPSNCLDLVAANGVLEWVGLSDHSKKVRSLQLQFLKEVNRVLKPSGCLYVGIENRFGFPFLLGALDHSGLPFTSLFPRKIADLVVKFFRKTYGDYQTEKRGSEEWQSYRTYTYTLEGYKKILREAGFNQINFYWALPSYNYPKYAGTFDCGSFSDYLHFRKQCFKYTKQDINSSYLKIASTISILPDSIIDFLGRLFYYEFLIFAYKTCKTTSFESKLLELGGCASSFVRSSGSRKINYFLFKQGKLSLVMKFPRFHENDSDLFNEEVRIQRFNRITVRMRKLDGIPIFIEPGIEGRFFEPLNIFHNRKALDWLLSFQEVTMKGIWNYEQLEKRIEPFISILSEINISKQLRVRTKKRMDSFFESLRKVKLEITSEHGDFSTENILMGNDMSVYVIDWECYEENGDPLFDFIYFIMQNSAITPDFRRNVLGNGKYSQIMKIMISEFSEKKELPDELISKGITYVILRCIYQTFHKVEQSQVERAKYIKLLKLWDEIYI